MKVKVVNHSKHPLPEYHTEHSAGLDLKANLELPVKIESIERVMIPTGLFIALPDGFEAQVRPRSGMTWKTGISIINSPGTIDADYRGEIKVVLINLSREPYTVHDGDRIAQLIISRYQQIEWEKVEGLDETIRGAGGYGSTGK